VGRSRPSVQSLQRPFLPEQVLAEIKAQGFDKLLIYPLLVVDSIIGIAVEQVNKALTQLADDTEHWVKGQRYIPPFTTTHQFVGSLGRGENCR